VVNGSAGLARFYW